MYSCTSTPLFNPGLSRLLLLRTYCCLVYHVGGCPELGRRPRVPLHLCRRARPGPAGSRVGVDLGSILGTRWRRKRACLEGACGPSFCCRSAGTRRQVCVCACAIQKAGHPLCKAFYSACLLSAGCLEVQGGGGTSFGVWWQAGLCKLPSLEFVAYSSCRKAKRTTPLACWNCKQLIAKHVHAHVPEDIGTFPVGAELGLA